MTTSPIGIRLANADDRPALRRLAALDDGVYPLGDVLVAEADGVLVAALPLAGDGALADPFRPTAQIVDLLRLRARQLLGDDPTARPGRLRRRFAVRTATPHPR